VAHTANDSVDLIDSRNDKYLRSIPRLPGVAGVLVSNEKNLVFTSNRGEKTVGVFQHSCEEGLEKISVGGFPNGLAFDPARNHLLAANVSKLDDPAPATVSMVDPQKRILLADIVVPGRTRWTVFDQKNDSFYVNISKPSQIVKINSRDPDGVEDTFEIPATGPHGLDIDVERRRLFCACDQGGLFTVDLESGKVSRASDLAGSPDVIFYNSKLHHLYVTIGDPGVVEVFDTHSMKLVQTVKTELGSHTIGFNPMNDKVYVFMPETHQAAVYVDA
jgi:DNA-binding beta-propeller fold protein YncE